MLSPADNLIEDLLIFSHCVCKQSLSLSPQEQQCRRLRLFWLIWWRTQSGWTSLIWTPQRSRADIHPLRHLHINSQHFHRVILFFFFFHLEKVCLIIWVNVLCSAAKGRVTEVAVISLISSRHRSSRVTGGCVPCSYSTARIAVLLSIFCNIVSKPQCICQHELLFQRRNCTLVQYFSSFSYFLHVKETTKGS